MFQCFCRYHGGRYERFTPLFVPNSVKTWHRRHGTSVPDEKPLPLVDNYDGNLHDFIANLRRVNGNPEPHEKYGPPVNIFAAGRKFWVTKSSPAFGYFTSTIIIIICIQPIIAIILFIRN